jgi:hypothetical protein
MERTGIRLLESPSCHAGQRDFSAKASVLRYGKQHFLNYGWLANAEKISGGELGKIKSLEKAS